MASLGNRIIVLIDMDCFFCQVETRLKPEFQGKPLAVVQYNQWKLGGIIAVNYEAREFGVTRHMRGEEAKEKCPEILLASVPCLRGKADTSRYRSAGREVIDVLKKNCNIVERASVDEAYLDITEIVDQKISQELFDHENILSQLNNTYIVGHSESGVNNEEERRKGLNSWLSKSSENIQIQRLSMAGALIENIRKEIYETTNFKCSAGISFNKILAKLACGLHKPNRQTILPASAVPALFGTLPIKKVRNLGGKLGDIVTDSLKCNVMADILPFSLQYLQNRFDEKTGLWLYNIARGIDSEPVTPRLVSKSIGACKKFPGKLAIIDTEVLKHWLGELLSEVCDRLEQDLDENERRASLLTVSFQYYQNKKSISQSRSCALTSYKPEKLVTQCLSIVTKATHQLPVSFLGLSAGKFVKAKGSENFINFFKSSTTEKLTATVENDNVNNISKIKTTPEETNEVFENFKISDNHCFGTNENLKINANSKINRRSSPCSKIQQSLKPDNFKKSFFMNILQEKNSNPKKLESILQTNIHSSEEHDSNIKLTSNLSDNNDMIYNSELILTNSDNSICYENSSTSKHNATIMLQEIFPDLNNIDPDVVKLLPLHLQQEADKFLKMSEICDNNIAINKEKCKDINKIKAKNCKSKINQKSSIQHFFIKTDVNNDLEKNFRKCLQCDQLILINKFNEHNDYHIAQNLQRELNQI